MHLFQKPTMDWGEEVEENEDKQLSDEKQQCIGGIGNADSINSAAPYSLPKMVGVLAGTDLVTNEHENSHKTLRRLSVGFLT